MHPGSGAQRRSTQSNTLHVGRSEADRRAVSPDGYRSEGTPSPGEGPDARGEPFFAYFFLAFEKKVSRRKGETLSRRYRNNGYVHNHPEHGRPKGRQAKSHFPTMKQANTPLPQSHSGLTSTKKKNSPQPPQVEGQNYRHSTNRTNNQNSSILAKPQANRPELHCPFDCHHGIANTHGNLMLPARNKE